MTEKEYTKFIGFNIDPATEEDLRLLAMAQDVSVSQVMRNVIRRWRENDPKGTSRKSFINHIVLRMKNDWERVQLDKMSTWKSQESRHTNFLKEWQIKFESKLGIELASQIIHSYEKD